MNAILSGKVKQQQWNGSLMKKKFIALALAVVLAVSMIACTNEAGTSNGSGSAAASTRVVIYSSQEDYRNEHLLTRLNEQFPNYNIVLEYLPTGDLAAKLKAEGANTEGDIVVGLETAYAESLSECFADLSSRDYSAYLDELVPTEKTTMTWERWSGCIVVNRDVLEKNGLSAPTSYQDLLNPEYKGLIVMPNPKSSGTGYFFLYNLVKTWGEDEAFAYFDKLSANILQFTSSGSGPIKSLLQGEAAIGLGMTFQSVKERNDGASFDILYFEEGAPYNTSSTGIIKGKSDRAAVNEVFDFIMTTLVREDKDLFSPEIIFKNQAIAVVDYPNVPYADMTGNTFDEKTRLLEKWKY
jgi:iron(III) transport system substrate-binding protein